MFDALASPIRRRIIREVRATVSGQTDGRPAIIPSDDALFAPGTPIRRIHGDVTAMMVGGIAALLLQMLHPRVLAGVWDHSDFRDNMLGRLHRTARFIAITTYAERHEAERAMARVRAIHAHVAGTLPDGTPYRADDPALLAWVHVSEALCFLDAYRRFGAEPVTAADEAAYLDAFATVAERLGADPVPRTRVAAHALVAATRPHLQVDARTREVARLVTRLRPSSAASVPAQLLTIRAAIDLLPDWARRMHGLPARRAARPLVRAGTAGMARAMRWAFAG